MFDLTKSPWAPLSKHEERIVMSSMYRASVRLALVAALALTTTCGPRPKDGTHPRGKSSADLPKDPFALLGVMEEKPGDSTFRLPSGPKPPKQPSVRLSSAFPRPEKPEGARKSYGELQVLRTQPEGEVKSIAAITATFNQPMIPLTSLEELEAKRAPMEIEPKPPGRFRWLGTTVLAYESKSRFPYSTRYEVRIPEGTESAVGGKLKSARTFEIRTPTVKLTSMLPSHASRHAVPEAPVVLMFNQKVDPNEVADNATLYDSANREVSWKLVDRSEWKSLPIYGEKAEEWEPDRTVVFQPAEELPKNTGFRVVLAAGLKSKEGPLVSKNEQRRSFSTYGPLRAIGAGCYHDFRPCHPSSTPHVKLTNQVRTPDDELGRYFRLKPKVEDLQPEVRGSYIYLFGTYRPATKYRLTIKPGLADIYGQKMKSRFTGTITIKDARPFLSFPARRQAVLEAKNNRKLAVSSINVDRGRVTMVEITPENMGRAFQILRGGSYRYRKTGKAAKIPGRKARFNQRFNRKSNVKETTELRLDRLLKGRSGAVFVEVYSKELKRKRWHNPYRWVLAQVTDLGVTARYDVDRIVLLSTGLSSGEPLEGVELTIYRRTEKTKGKRKNKRDKPRYVWKKSWEGETGSQGLAVAPGARKLAGAGKRGPYIVIAKKGKQRAFLLLDGYGEGRGGYVSGYSRWTAVPPPRALRAHVFTDRDPYRPGDTVHIAGALRSAAFGPKQGLEPVKGKNLRIDYKITGPRGRKMADGEVKVDPDGMFEVDFRSKPGESVGRYTFYARLKGATNVADPSAFYHNFQILEYRAPEYEVDVELHGEPYFYEQKLKATVSAEYTFGAPMAGGNARWTLRRAPGSYRPPGHDEFTFGVRPPWRWGWRYAQGRRGGRHGRYFVSSGPSGGIIAKGEARLDDEGKLDIAHTLERGEGEERLVSTGSFTLEAQVFDVNRQAIANRAVAVVHPASFYVGLRVKKSIVKAGEPLDVQGVAVDLDGKRMRNVPVTVRAMKKVIKRKMIKKGRYWSYDYSVSRKEVGRCSIRSSEDVRSCRLRFKKPGYYELDGVAKDGEGRETVTRTAVYVAGKSFIPWKQDNRNRIELVADQKDYEPGDRARVLIKNPFRRAVGILAVEHNGIVEHRFLDLRSSTHVEEVKLTEDQIPNAIVSVALVRGRVKPPKGSDPGQDPGRPLFATGRVELPVSSKSKQVTVAVEPNRKQIRPGQSFRLSLQTTDHRGKPLPARLAVMLVDEGVLSLLGFETPDPMKVFYPNASPQTALEAIRAKLVKKLKEKARRRRQTKSKQEMRSRRGAMGKGGGGFARAAAAPVGSATAALGEARRSVDDSVMKSAELDATTGADKGGVKLKTRTHFATTAYFNANIKTDGNGRASVDIDMPENLTTFRIMAVAIDAKRPDRFGNGQSRIKIRKKLLLRPALPRFSNFGDRFDAAVVINNETGKKGEATVKIQATGVTILGRTTKKVTVEEGRAREVSFRVVPTRPGLARFRFSAVMGEHNDSVEPAPLPVKVPATTEAFATYGVTTKSVAQPVSAPKDALPQFGGLEVSLSSTALTGLQDAVKFLVDYPYECTEQTASRVVPIFALGEILSEFDIGKLGDRDKQKALAERGIKKLISLQRYDGGFAFWPGSHRSSPYVSVYATWALLRGREAGFEIPPQTLRRAARYVYRAMAGKLPWPWNRYWSFRMMAAWVLSEMRDLDVISKPIRSKWSFKKHLKTLYGHRKKVPTFALAWLLSSFHRLNTGSTEQAELTRLIDNRAVQTPAGAHFTEKVTESLRLLLHSESRTDAIVLSTLMEVSPKHALVPKIVSALMSARVKGRWETTQANAYAMHALATYFRKYESKIPDFKADVWLGDGYVASKGFRGRSMKIAEKKIPMSYLVKQGESDLVVAKKGTGKLYYRLGLRYAPKSLELLPREEGFMVSRVYEPVEGKDTVRKGKDGIWRIKAGKYVRVRLTVVVPDRRYYVAVDDPLPAGLEGVDMKLKTSATSSLGSKSKNKIYDFWSLYSFRRPSHEEMRDDRYVLFWNRLPAGVYEYTYLARATSTGRFVVPPLKAHEMYHPEVFGRNGTEVVEIVD
jgi:hypothetical protein